MSDPEIVADDLVPAEVLGSDRSIGVLAVSRVKPGKEDEFEELVRSVLASVREEPGCEQYVVHLRSRKPGVYVVYERYACGADLVKHLSMPFVQDFFSRAGELVEGPPETTWLWPIEA